MTDDEQEAGSFKYNVARIVRLASGNFALFHPWSNKEGMPLVAIGSLEDIAELIPTTAEIGAYLEENREVYTFTPQERDIGKGLLAQLGLTRPKEPLRRRI